MDDHDRGRRRLQSRFLLLFAGLALMDLLFWAGARFETFMPPSAGPWQERVYYAAITALGPAAMMTMGFEWATRDGLIALGLIVVTVALALRRPDVAALRHLGYFAIFTWWFLGFGVAAIRIT